MKDIKIALLVVAAFLSSHLLAAAGGEAGGCKKVAVKFKKGKNYLTWVSLGENPFDVQGGVKGLLERYFVGDPIRGRLYLGSMCAEPPLRREDLESAPECLSLRVFPMEKDEKGIYHSIGDKPIASGRIGSLKIDRNDPWNVERKDKLYFSSNEEHNEGLLTEYFDIGDVIGQSLPVGSYQLEIVSDEENCPIHIQMHWGYRWIKIIEPDTPKLRAYKLCREAGKILKGRREDLEVLKDVISRKIMPALEIDPGAVCAFNYLAHYNRVLGNREEFKKYFRMFCDGQTDQHFKKACLRSLKLDLKNWDNPRWWGHGKGKPEEKASPSEQKVKGGLRWEAWQLCRQASKIMSKRKGYYDREAWDRAVKEYYLPALEIDPKCFCALDRLLDYYHEINKDKQKYIEYASRMCEAASVDGLRLLCPEIRPVDYDGSCEDVQEEKLREFCHRFFVDRMVEKVDWGD